MAASDPTPRDLLLLGKLEEAADEVVCRYGHHEAVCNARMFLVADGPKGREKVERLIQMAEELEQTPPVRRPRAGGTLDRR